MPRHYYNDSEIRSYVDKRVLKSTLKRFSYMNERQLITRTNRLTHKEKILATIMVSVKLNILEVKRAAIVRLYTVHGDYYVGRIGSDPGLNDQVVYDGSPTSKN